MIKQHETLEKIPYFIDSFSAKHKNKFLVTIICVTTLCIFSFGWLVGVHNMNSTKFIVDLWAVLSSVGSILSGTGTIAAAYVAWLAYKNWLNPIKTPKERECDLDFYKKYMEFHKLHIHPFYSIDELEKHLFQEVRNYDENSQWSLDNHQDYWQEQREELALNKYIDMPDMLRIHRALLEPLEALPRDDSILKSKIRHYLFGLVEVHRSLVA